MTISMFEQASDDLCQEIEGQCQYPDPDDVLDVVYQQPQWLSKGYVREIELREGLELAIDNYRLRDRIYHAREILLQRLDNPPTLMELARQVGLNECTLKREFRQVFGKTVFSYLHDYRLAQARLLLDMEDMSTAQVSRMVGFANRGYFAAVFREKFGLNPKEYQKQRKILSSD